MLSHSRSQHNYRPVPHSAEVLFCAGKKIAGSDRLADRAPEEYRSAV